MIQRFGQTLCLILIFVFQTGLFADSPTFTGATQEFVEPVKAELVHEMESIQPGTPFLVGVRLNLDKKWHAYWKNPGDAGMAPVVDWDLPEGFSAGEIMWPVPHRFETEYQVAFGYEDEVVLLAEITPPKTLTTNTAHIGADLRWVVCDDATCLPGGASVAIDVPVSNTQSRPHTEFAATFKKARSELPKGHEGITAEQNSELITLKVKTDQNVTRATFFPNDLDQIDYKVEATIAPIEGQTGQYQVVLKSIAPLNTIKGVVALYSDHDTHHFTEAYDISLPVVEKTDYSVAMADEIPTLTPNTHEFQGGFFLALGLAFLGGLILNLMPCVLPVISFKILSFVKMAGESRSLIFRHGVAFSIGVLVSFWTLAGVLLILQSYGRSVGWGFQLQEPLFVAILAAIIFVFGLSLFGVFELGAGFASKAGQAQVKTSGKTEGLKASFFSGILATAVATPCTGPFLGTAIGFAVTLPAPLAMLIFTSLGLGMSSPYLLVGAFPGLLRFFPKPGNWMITFKEIMGFIMLATVLWLLWVFSAQTSAIALFLLIAGFFFLSLGSWVYGKWGSPVNKKISRLISSTIALSCLAFGGYTIYQASNTVFIPDNLDFETEIAMANDQDPLLRWEKFSPTRIAELQKQGTPVFVDFTAKWCLICQANHLTLSTDEVVNKFADLGVVKMKADWTKNDPVITKELAKFGRNGVPLYVLYFPNSDRAPEILPQTLTPGIVLEHLERVGG